MLAPVLAFGLLLALPTVRGAVAGQIDPGSAMARILMAMAVAWAGVSLVRSVVARHAAVATTDDPATVTPGEAPPG